MQQLKYFNPETEKWEIFRVEGGDVRFTYGEFKGKTLTRVLSELKKTVLRNGALRHHDGNLLADESIQESKLSPDLQTKINEHTHEEYALKEETENKVDSNAKNIVVSSTEPNNPNENDIWIVI